MTRHRLKSADLPKAGDAHVARAVAYKGPEVDPCAGRQTAPAVKEAEQIGIRFGLTYLTMTGYSKLADLIRYIRNEP